MSDNITDYLFAAVDRSIGRASLLSGILDRVVTRLAPGIHAVACHPAPLCYQYCSSSAYSCGTCSNGQRTCWYMMVEARRCGYPNSWDCKEIPHPSTSCGSFVQSC